LSTERDLGWFKAPEIGFRIPWTDGLGRAVVRLVGAINGINLWFSGVNDCTAGLLEEFVTGDLSLDRLRE